MTDVASGSSALQYYTATFFGKWAVTEVASEGRSGWLSMEATYVLQLTPLASLQPDVQVIWNPANNPNAGHNLIFQLQLNLTW